MLTCIPDVLSRNEIRQIQDWIGATDFIDGKKTAGFRAQRVKHNEQAGRNAPSRDEINSLILRALNDNAEVRAFAMPRKVQTPLLSRYRPGMEYGLHVDDALMGPSRQWRSDLSITVFLNQPDEYEGGALEIHDSGGCQSVKLPAGSAVIYPALTLHRVTPITDGLRLAAVTWAQSTIRDPARREILQDMDQVRRQMAKLAPESPETDLAFKTYANLMRRWAE
ncbi:MAG: Fe2+-dependent dioxygenase [Alphaproteobacteria bacterium]